MFCTFIRFWAPAGASLFYNWYTTYCYAIWWGPLATDGLVFIFGMHIDYESIKLPMTF